MSCRAVIANAGEWGMLTCQKPIESIESKIGEKINIYKVFGGHPSGRVRYIQRLIRGGNKDRMKARSTLISLNAGYDSLASAQWLAEYPVARRDSATGYDWPS